MIVKLDWFISYTMRSESELSFVFREEQKVR